MQSRHYSKKFRLMRRAGMMLAASLVMVILLGTGTALADWCGYEYCNGDDTTWIHGLSPAEGSTISTSSTTITATFWYGDGDVDQDWSITLDGTQLSCSTTGYSQQYWHEGLGWIYDIEVSCPVSGLSVGPHQYTAEEWGYYEYDDITWWNAQTVSFNVQGSCTPAKPALSLSNTGASWASYADYTARLLSVNYGISNGGSSGASSVAIVGTVNTNSVAFSSATPVGAIAAGGSAPVTVKYSVPAGVAGFQSTVYATASDACGSSYAYPGPMGS